jgi:hypothetical protein
LVTHLVLNVRRVPEGSGWQWQLVDERDDSVFETELPYETAMDAQAAGLARLSELTPSLPGAKASARIAHTPSAGHVIIVSRNDRILYGVLKRAFGASEGIEVIQDRRQSLSAMDRPVTDRRDPDVELEAQGPGWWMARRSDVRRSTRQRKESA